MGWKAQGTKEGPPLFLCEVTPFSRLEIPQVKRPDRRADETQGGVTDGRGHTADLPFAPLPQGDA